MKVSKIKEFLFLNKLISHLAVIYIIARVSCFIIFSIKYGYIHWDPVAPIEKVTIGLVSIISLFFMITLFWQIANMLIMFGEILKNSLDDEDRDQQGNN